MDEKKNSGRLPLIITGVVLIAAVIAVVVAIGLKENGKKKESGSENYLEYAKEKLVTAGDYKNFTYGHFVYEVTDELIQETYENMVKTYADAGIKGYEKDESRNGTKIEKGDTVNVDYTGYLDGVAFDRGADTDFNITVGSGSFIEDFENGLIGHTTGEKFEIQAKFPDNYSLSTELAGKEVVFSVTVNYICREVELTVDNAYSQLFYMDSLEDMKEYLRTYLTENPTETEESYLENTKATYIQQIIDGSEFGDISEDVEERYQKVLSLYEDYAKQQNTTLDAMVSGLGFDSMDSFKAKYTEASETLAKNEILFAVIGDTENIEMSEDDYKRVALEYGQSAGYTTLEDYEKAYEETYGSGTLRRYVYTVYVQDALFEKYAKEI